jgi:MFS family permease
VVTLFAGRRLADRLGRRPVLLLGLGGTALAYALLSLVGGLGSLVAVLVLYGLFVSFVDLGANTVGADTSAPTASR